MPNSKLLNRVVNEKLKRKKLLFNEKQIELLKLYGLKQKISITELSKHLDCSIHNIKYLNKKIIELTHENGLGKFKTAKEVAIYFKQIGWIKH